MAVNLRKYQGCISSRIKKGWNSVLLMPNHFVCFCIPDFMGTSDASDFKNNLSSYQCLDTVLSWKSIGSTVDLGIVHGLGIIQKFITISSTLRLSYKAVL